MTVQVVVTRPLEEAEDLAGELTRRGFEPLVAPMLAIEPLDTKLPALGGYAALAFTSANGARAFAGRSPERAIPTFAVGETTAAALRAAGFEDISLAGGDAEALAAAIALKSRGPILHVSGRAVARDLGILLGSSGIAVDRAELYDSRVVTRLSPRLAAALSASAIQYVLFYSTRTASTFGTLVTNAGLDRMVREVTAICLSDQVAAGAGALPWLDVKIAERPRTPELLALLPSAAMRGQERT